MGWLERQWDGLSDSGTPPWGSGLVKEAPGDVHQIPCMDLDGARAYQGCVGQGGMGQGCMGQGRMGQGCRCMEKGMGHEGHLAGFK